MSGIKGGQCNQKTQCQDPCKLTLICRDPCQDPCKPQGQGNRQHHHHQHGHYQQDPCKPCCPDPCKPCCPDPCKPCCPDPCQAQGRCCCNK